MISCGLVKAILDLKFFTHVQPRTGWLRIYSDNRKIIIGLGWDPVREEGTPHVLNVFLQNNFYLNNLVSESE